MLIIALVLAVVSLAALVTAVVTSNEVIAWICIGFSALGILLLIIDAIRDRHQQTAVRAADGTEVLAPVGVTPSDVPGVEVTEVIEPVDDEVGGSEDANDAEVAEYPATDDESTPGTLDEQIRVEDHPDEVIHDEPDYDTPSDDEPVYPLAAEAAAIHIVTDEDVQIEPDEDGLAEPDEDGLAEDDEDALTEPGEDALTEPGEDALTEPDEDGLAEPDEDGSEESDAVMTEDGSTAVVYADETDASESGDERGESDAR